MCVKCANMAEKKHNNNIMGAISLKANSRGEKRLLEKFTEYFN